MHGSGSRATASRRRSGRAALAVAGLAAIGLVGARLLRAADAREAEAAWATLAGRAEPRPACFDPAMIADLPEPARRYFRFAIAPGTPLRAVAIVEMGGRFGLGDKADHRFYPMRARQILAPPQGFVWIPRIGSGLMRMSGSDALVGETAWTRFWLLGSVPLVRASGTADLARSAVGRAVGEALWAPAALLPANGVAWEPVDADRARAVLTVRGERHAVELAVAPDGRPLSVALDRWSDANPERVFRWQPFGATIEAVGSFGGYTVPTRIRGGNHFGTGDYFPFFQAEVTAVDYP
jgi:hypothetical protein